VRVCLGAEHAPRKTSAGIVGESQAACVSCTTPSSPSQRSDLVQANFTCTCVPLTAGAAAVPLGGLAPPPIDAPCTQCLRHGDPIHARKGLTAAAAAAVGAQVLHPLEQLLEVQPAGKLRRTRKTEPGGRVKETMSTVD
jgi:hypothetical protein